MAKKKAADTVFRLELNGEILEFDMDSLTFGEIEFVESYFDRPIEAVPWETVRASMVIYALAKRRVDPTFDISELRDVKISALKEAPKPKRPTKADPKPDGDQP